MVPGGDTVITLTKVAQKEAKLFDALGCFDYDVDRFTHVAATLNNYLKAKKYGAMK